MATVIEKIIVAILTKLTSWLFAKGLEKIHGAQEKAATEKDIDQKLAAFKTAYSEAFDGTKITAEQRAKLYNSISNFLRNSSPGGL
jgi:hypothetical protein